MTVDTLIQNATVVDGTGKTTPYRADVAIARDRIAAVGDLSGVGAGRRIDASGLVLAPGFIDVHVHSELALLGSRDQCAHVRQGVTTQLLAPDGFGWAGMPLDKARDMWAGTRFAYGDVQIDPDWPCIEDYLSLFPGCSPANVYPQVPHGAVRMAAVGWDARPATDAELEQMVRLTRDWMEAGAGALNCGLDYQPAVHADTRELVALCEVVASCGGIYAAHIRKCILGRREAWEETFELHRRTGIPVHISHERVDVEAASLLDGADRDGIDITFESYLYSAGMTHMTMMVPMEVQAGSPAEVLERLRDPAVRERSLPYLREQLGRMDQVVSYTRSGRFVGLTVVEAASRSGVTPEAFAYDLILEEEGMQCFIFPWQVPPEEAEETVAATAVHPRMMIASDGAYNMPHPHPRGTGCYARVLGEFVRERKLLTLQEAVFKMSGFPAQRFGLRDRGEISEGGAADLVVFDPETVAAGSTFQEPLLPPVGIDWVFVNGQPVVESGQVTERRPGRVLRRNA